MPCWWGSSAAACLDTLEPCLASIPSTWQALTPLHCKPCIPETSLNPVAVTAAAVLLPGCAVKGGGPGCDAQQGAAPGSSTRPPHLTWRGGCTAAHQVQARQVRDRTVLPPCMLLVLLAQGPGKQCDASLKTLLEYMCSNT
jgi:hypothetical protein